MRHLLAVFAFLLLQFSDCSHLASQIYHNHSNYQPQNHSSNHQKYDQQLPHTNHSNSLQFDQPTGKNSSGGASNHKHSEYNPQTYEHHKLDHPSVPLTLGEEPRKQLLQDYPLARQDNKTLTHYMIMIAKYSCLGFFNLMLLFIGGVYYLFQNKKREQRIVKQKVERERLQKFAFSEGPYLLSL